VGPKEGRIGIDADDVHTPDAFFFYPWRRPPTGQATPCNAQALVFKAVHCAGFRKIAKA
jgi:hypothetical protein